MEGTTRNRPSPTSLAFSLVVNVEEGAEMNIVDGDRGPEPVDEMGLALRSPVRNLGNESNYRYGILEGFPRVAALVDRLQVPATWTCAAVALQRAPQIARFISDRGDEAASHGERWVHQHRMTPDEERAFLRAARDGIRAAVGRDPAGHLSRYLFTSHTRQLLVEEGFTYSMDDYSRDEPFWEVTDAGPIVVVPYAIDTNDMKMWACPGYTPQDWVDAARRTFDVLYAERRPGHRMVSLGVHLRIIGRPSRIWALEAVLEHVLAHDDVWPVTRGELAADFAAVVGRP